MHKKVIEQPFTGINLDRNNTESTLFSAMISTQESGLTVLQNYLCVYLDIYSLKWDYIEAWGIIDL